MQLTLIQQKIWEIRDHRVMLDFDLATLYDVETKALNQAVKRNMERFPTEYMFRLTKKEWDSMRSQFVTASQRKRNTTVTPFAFTEHGVAMLASVLKSKRAIKVNIAIINAFIAMRQFSLSFKDVKKEIAEIRKSIRGQKKQLGQVSTVLEKLLSEREKKLNWENRERIGYRKQNYR